MPATTPKYALPYPLPTEPVAEGALAIRNLAEALDALLTGKELAYAEMAAQTTITATSGATANTLISLPSLTFDGSTRIRLDFWCSQLLAPNVANGSTLVHLWMDALDQGQIARILSPSANASFLTSPGLGSRFLTPAAGAHVFSVRGWVSPSGSGTIYNVLPAFLRATRA